MKIVDFSDKYLDNMVMIFVKEYSESGRVWNLETAKEYLNRNIKNFPEYCKVVVNDEGEFIGGICCSIDPYYSGKLLFIDSLEVSEKFRNKGVAKTLLKNIVEIAKNNKINGIHFLGDGRKGFPKEWYQKMGFVETGWIQYEIKLEDLKI